MRWYRRATATPIWNAVWPTPARCGSALVPFVSYMALHSDVTHLVINCLFLFAFGPIVARRFGAVLFLLFFLRLWRGVGAFSTWP